MKIYKQFKYKENTFIIYGSNRISQIYYAKPEWSDEKEPYIRYQNHRYYLSEFTKIEPYFSKDMQEFNGVLSETFFSGILIKLIDDDYVKVFSYF